MKRIIRSLCCLSAAFGGFFGVPSASAAEEGGAAAFSDDNISCTDGSVQAIPIGNRVVYVFTDVSAAAQIEILRDVTVEQFLIVGGGGGAGGGGALGGGGGAGGLVYSDEPQFLTEGTMLSVVVGAGGNPDQNGGDSTLTVSGEDRTAKGGGAGGRWPNGSGADGGSGGGSYAGYAAGKGTEGQGYDGGVAGVSNCGGGGGGAGGEGKNNANGRRGGPGVVCNITGEPLEYARGGNGGAQNAGIPYEPAGVDGRGDGGGGGCMGGGYSEHNGMRGGSGTVILRLAKGGTASYRFAVDTPGEQVYLGEAIRPRPAVRNVVTGAVLTEGVDFTYAYENCDAPGRGTVTANGREGTGYEGYVASAEFDIVNGFQFAVEPIPNQPFLGGPVCPSPTVYNSVVGGELAEGYDYTVDYENNEAVGQAKAIVSGKEGTGYEGFAVTSCFEIVAAYFDEYVYTMDASVRRIDDGARRIYVFTNAVGAVSLNLLANMTLTEWLVVGGGGGGGSEAGGGGGAGGYVAVTNRVVLSEANNVVVCVGKGGAASADGGDSSLAIDDVIYGARGGGHGGSWGFGSTIVGTDGGSGGGSFSSGAAGKGTDGQGHDGAVAIGSGGNAGGGGGGAGGAGKNYANGRWGGVGITNAITGAELEYARGGKGGVLSPALPSVPAGVDGRGDGGDGGCGDRHAGARGGNGTVILALEEGGTFGQPEFGAGGIEVTFQHETSVPLARVTLAGAEDAVYQATVTLEFGVEEGVYTCSKVVDGLSRGAEVSYLGELAPEKDATLWVRATVSAVGAEDRVLTKSVTVPYDRPAWFGKGGGAGIVHVRPDAFGDGSGSDWMNAVPDIRAAFRRLSATMGEVWIAGDWTLTNALETTTLVAPAVIRGGFAGVECALAERPRGGRSVLDGGDEQDILRFAGNHLLTLDSIEFTHARARAVERTDGALLVTNCNFEANGTTRGGLDARALYAFGSASVTADFVDTRFAKNTETGTYAKEGCCVLLSTFRRATFDNCTFTTNGIIPNVVSGTSGFGEGGVCKGAALKVDNAPLTVRNCRFLANRTSCRESNGGTVRLFNGSYPSGFTNCLFAGNSDRMSNGAAGEPVETGGGALVLDLGSAAGLVEVDTCTFA